MCDKITVRNFLDCWDTVSLGDLGLFIFMLASIVILSFIVYGMFRIK